VGKRPCLVEQAEAKILEVENTAKIDKIYTIRLVGKIEFARKIE